MVFQLSDDIIDITSDATGKTPGTDLREGIPTLPTILARKSADPPTLGCSSCSTATCSDDDALREVLDLLRHHRCIDGGEVGAVPKPPESSRTLPAGPARDALDDLCTTVVTRTA